MAKAAAAELRNPDLARKHGELIRELTGGKVDRRPLVQDQLNRIVAQDRELIRLNQEHAARQYESASGKTLTGVRLVDPEDGDAPGEVITFEEVEADQVMAVIHKVLKARASKRS